MNYSSIIADLRSLSRMLVVIALVTNSVSSNAQNCPANLPATISINPNTYYPGFDSDISAGVTSITLGPVGSGTTPISSGDLLLLIQMQGAEINATNTSSYGDGIDGLSANGYLDNGQLMAGNMEYVVATNAVPLTGGTLTLLNGTTHAYKNAAYGSMGQYRYQVIRIGLYHSLTLSNTITAQPWNGTSGGVVVLSITNQLNFNGQTISAAGAGFRGGAGRQLGGSTGGLRTDLVSLSTSNFNGSKGEGIAGTPRFINHNGTLIDNGGTLEGYPGGSYAAGAPGNAGGGGTDGNPAANDQNSGGGGGANGGPGGKGGNSWSSNVSTGGEPGKDFAQRSPSRLIMGGGGGAGTTNNGTGTPNAGFASSGAAGGGIVLITAGSITGTGIVDVSGAHAYTTVVNDGNGGGGAGGSVLIYTASGHSGITVLAAGGNGGNNSGGGSPPPHGPGGGGGGGVIYSNAALNPASTAAAGLGGLTTGSVVYGAANGSAGSKVENVAVNQLPPQYLSCSVLPVRFTNVSAKPQDKKVLVQWQVTNESAVTEYIVERSSDNKHFASAGSVAYRYSATGKNTYTFSDKLINAGGTIYYRIRQQGAGASQYSNVVTVRSQTDEIATTCTVLPNPVTGAVASVRLTAKKQGAHTATIRIITMSGITVHRTQHVLHEGMNTLPLGNLSSIPNGTYLVQCYDGEKTTNAKMLIKH